MGVHTARFTPTAGSIRGENNFPIQRLHPQCQLNLFNQFTSKSFLALPRVAIPHRSLNTTKHQNTPHDEATMDFAYIPQDALSAPVEAETVRVPLLPDNFRPPIEHTNNVHNDVHMESVTRPIISTVSANGTHIESPSPFSDVIDNHAVDIDVFDLTRKVTNAAASKVVRVADLGAKEAERQGGVLREILSSIVDDVFGSKKAARA